MEVAPSPSPSAVLKVCLFHGMTILCGLLLLDCGQQRFKLGWGTTLLGPGLCFELFQLSRVSALGLPPGLPRRPGGLLFTIQPLGTRVTSWAPAFSLLQCRDASLQGFLAWGPAVPIQLLLLPVSASAPAPWKVDPDNLSCAT